MASYIKVRRKAILRHLPLPLRITFWVNDVLNAYGVFSIIARCLRMTSLFWGKSVVTHCHILWQGWESDLAALINCCRFFFCPFITFWVILLVAKYFAAMTTTCIRNYIKHLSPWSCIDCYEQPQSLLMLSWHAKTSLWFVYVLIKSCYVFNRKPRITYFTMS